MPEQRPVADRDGCCVLCLDWPLALPLQAAQDRYLRGDDAADHATIPERGHHGYSAVSGVRIRFLHVLLSAQYSCECDHMYCTCHCTEYMYDCLGCAVALPCCLFDLACFFLPSF